MKIAVGDSLTYGEELTDRSLAWPGLIGYQNYGLRGASNEYIFRKAIELAPDATHMIVAWSDSGRYELYTNMEIDVSERYCHHMGIIQVNPGWTQMNAWFKELYGNFSDEEHQLIKTLSYMVALQDVLSINKVDYKFCSAFSNQQLFKKYENSELIKPWLDRINSEMFIGFPYHGFVEWSYGTPCGPGGHPLEQGHKLIAEKLLEVI